MLQTTQVTQHTAEDRVLYVALIYRKFKNSFPGALRPESSMVGQARRPVFMWPGRISTAVGLTRWVAGPSPLAGGRSIVWRLTDRRPPGKCSRARAANRYRSAKAGGQLVASAGGTRRRQRIRWPSRSTSGDGPLKPLSPHALGNQRFNFLNGLDQLPWRQAELLCTHASRRLGSRRARKYEHDPECHYCVNGMSHGFRPQLS